MPAKKRQKYIRHQIVEVGNGKKQKPLVGEILDFQRTYRYTQAYGRGGSVRQVKSSVIQYEVHFFGEQSARWIYQEQILRAQADPTQEELEAQARRLYGEDYL